MNDFSAFCYINFNCQIYCLKCNLVSDKFNSKQNTKMNNVQVNSFFSFRISDFMGWGGGGDRNGCVTVV